MLVNSEAPMSDPLQRVVSRTLWLVVAPPFAAFVWQFVRGLRGAGGAYDPWPRRLGVGSILSASAALLGHEFALARAPRGAGGLLEPAVGGARLGALDVRFGLAFDRLSVCACTLACVVALAAAANLGTRRASPEVDPRPWKSWAWLELSLSGGLLSFLAGGLATAWLGWTLVGASAAWLAGWSDTKAGALRATRVALAIFAMLAGDSLVSGTNPGSWDAATGRGLDAYAASLALAAFLAAAASMSASAPQPRTAPALAAFDAGATTGLLGPFLLLREASLVPRLPHGAAVVTVTGAALVVLAARRARAAPPGLPRWVAGVGGAPAGLVLVALGVDGRQGGALVFVSAGIVAALVLGIAGAATPGAAHASASARSPRPSVERALLGHAPEAGATLLMAFERWVVDSLAGSVGVVVHALAWALVQFDAQVAGAPANALAGRTVRLGRRLEPFVGGSLARVVWVLVGTAVLATLLSALWPVR